MRNPNWPGGQDIRLTAQEFSTLRQRMHVPTFDFIARALGISWRQVMRYEAGDQPVSGPVSRLMLMFARHGIPRDFT
jgi:DNA-binding transcriptional regulator YiaG